MRLGSNTPIRPSAATRNAAGGHEPQALSQAGAAGTTTLAHNLKLGITRPPVLLLMSGCLRSSIGGPVKVKNEHSFGCAAATDPRQQQSTTDEELSTVGGNMRSGSLLPTLLPSIPDSSAFAASPKNPKPSRSCSSSSHCLGTTATKNKDGTATAITHFSGHKSRECLRGNVQFLKT